MALPSTKISVGLVKQTLGAATNSVGKLCTHINVNPWSRWKPINIPDDLVGNNMPKGISTVTPYGIRINGVRIESTNWDNCFEYDRPSGGAGSPYRLGDFRNYNHAAKCPIEYVLKDTLFASVNNYMSLATFHTGTSTSLGVEDLYFQGYDIRNYLLGFKVQTRAGRYFKTFPSGITPIIKPGWLGSSVFQENQTKDVEVWVFFSKHEIPEWTSNVLELSSPDLIFVVPTGGNNVGYRHYGDLPAFPAETSTKVFGCQLGVIQSKCTIEGNLSLTNSNGFVNVEVVIKTGNYKLKTININTSSKYIEESINVFFTDFQQNISAWPISICEIKWFDTIQEYIEVPLWSGMVTSTLF